MFFLVISAATVVVEVRACLNEEAVYRQQPHYFKSLQPCLYLPTDDLAEERSCQQFTVGSAITAVGRPAISVFRFLDAAVLQADARH
ncbi:hypothetical protein [Vreelandella olivaria]|uniref:hypothetical protein n=1 Tax=Vreelandella olivaria TaxID=390919 RepID=UPI00201F8202|nr:hypothetical protein [Halomonas olivaria]